MKNLTTLLIALFLTTGFAMAQLGSIKGVVKDEQGVRLPGATVYIDVNGAPTQGTTTNIDGEYKISGLNPGTYTVVISFTGYKTIKYTDVIVTANEYVYVNADMKINSTDLPIVDIVCYDCEKPLIKRGESGVEYLTASDFKSNPNINTPKMMLRAIGGVKVAENGKDVYIRGSRPENTQIIVDGVKSPDGEMHIPGQAIGSIKVYTGGVPAVYGDVIGGVVVVQTKSYFDLAKQYKK